MLGLVWWIIAASDDGRDEVATAASAPVAAADSAYDRTANTVGNTVNAVGNAVDNGADAVGNAVAGNTINDLGALSGDLARYVGRDVALNQVRVQSVAGDRLFFVGSAGNTFAVVLDETRTPGQPGIEGRYDVTAGKTIDVNGVIRRVSDIPGGVQGLPANTTAVIWAQSLGGLAATNTAGGY